MAAETPSLTLAEQYLANHLRQALQLVIDSNTPERMSVTAKGDFPKNPAPPEAYEVKFNLNYDGTQGYIKISLYPEKK